MGKTVTGIRLNQEILHLLEERGFRFMLIKGYAMDRRQDYMEPKYFTLIPVTDLPVAPDQKGIYEPLNSAILQDWASLPNDYPEVIIEMPPNFK